MVKQEASRLPPPGRPAKPPHREGISKWVNEQMSKSATFLLADLRIRYLRIRYLRIR
jgi:hypothetical protein